MATRLDLRIGDVVDLPAGTYEVTGCLRYDSAALTWQVWDLDGGTARLAEVGGQVYTPTLAEVEALPRDQELQIEGGAYKFVREAEARVARETKTERDFWRARFRHYRGPQGRVAIFSEDKDAVHRLLGESFDASLVQVHRV